MPRRRRLHLAAVAASAVLTLAACGGGDDTGDATDRATGRYGAVHTELCTALAEAEDGDLAAARRTFDDVHAGIHELATAAGEADRPTAARLLEAKQRVEAELTAKTLRALLPPVAEAVERTGGTAPTTCP